eukprot:767502-Hanusia_phi.AAC.6
MRNEDKIRSGTWSGEVCEGRERGLRPWTCVRARREGYEREEVVMRQQGEEKPSLEFHLGSAAPVRASDFMPVAGKRTMNGAHHPADRVTLFGVGRLGICTALCLEKAGYHVLGVDVNSAYIDKFFLRFLISLCDASLFLPPCLLARTCPLTIAFVSDVLEPDQQQDTQ